MWKPKLLQAMFWVGWSLILWALFEEYLKSSEPVWSSVFGPPFLHHGYYGLILVVLAWVFTYTFRWLKNRK